MADAVVVDGGNTAGSAHTPKGKGAGFFGRNIDFKSQVLVVRDRETAFVLGFLKPYMR